MALDASNVTTVFCRPPQLENSDGASKWTTARNLTGECGPHCRPSCITFMLNLNNLLQNHPPVCLHSANSCGYHRNSRCNQTVAPTCELEHANCFGPALFDDKVSHLVEHHQQLFDHHERCNTFPMGDDGDRFRGWPMATPMYPLSTNSCNIGSNNSDRLFFKFCNVVGEDCEPYTTSGEDLEHSCSKRVEPFVDGWTTFIVSASIPFRGPVRHCMETVKLPLTSGSLCWAERVSIYYPQGCPHCHTCPNIGLGDRFGPLEVVALGSKGSDPCSSCDSNEQRSDEGFTCQALDQCRNSADCESAASLGVPLFTENNHSFTRTALKSAMNETFTSISPDFLGTNDASDSVSLPIYDEAGAPEPEFYEAGEPGTGWGTYESPSAGSLGFPEAPPSKLLSNIVITSPIACAMVIIAAMMFSRRVWRGCRKRSRTTGEEIVYVESADGRAIDEMLSHTEEEMEIPADIEINDDSENATTITPLPPPPQPNTARKSRKYFTTSLLESTRKNEVEVLFMEGTHHTN